MAAETFGWTPDYGSTVEVQPRIREVRFGDGYGQSVAAGINTQPQQRSLTFGNRPSAEIDAIAAFLASHGGVRWFWYAYPGAAAIKVKCKKWSRTHVAHGIDTLSCAFEQDFSPGA